MKNSVTIGLLLAISILFNTQTTLCGQQEWLSPGHEFSSSYANDQSWAVAVDENGAVYTTGLSSNYDNSLGTYVEKIPIKKFSPYGKRVVQAHHDVSPTNWANFPEEWGNDIAVSAQYDRVVVGGSKSMWGCPYLGFYTRDGAFVNQIPFNINTTSGAVSKIDIVGNAVWVIGNFNGTITLDPNWPSFTGNSSQSSYFTNIFIAKYNITTGNLMAGFFLVGAGYLQAFDIKADPYGYIYFTAKTDNNVQFIGAPGVYAPSVTGKKEGFVCRINTNNYTLSWVKSITPSNYTTGAYDRFPLGIGIGDESSYVVLAGYDHTNNNAYIQRRNAANGNLVDQSPVNTSYNMHVIQDLTVSNCGSSKIMAVGNEVLSNGASGLGFMFEFTLGSFNNGLYYYTSNPAEIRAVAADSQGHPAIAGNTPSNASGVQFRGASATQNGDSHEFAGKFKANNACCPNRGLAFDGVDDYLEAALAPSSSDFTFEAWVYSTATNTGACTGQFRRLLGWNYSGNNHIEIGECSGNLVINTYRRIFTNTVLYQSTSNQSLRGAWWHVAVTKSGATISVYVNGNPVAMSTPAILGFTNVPNGKFYLGRGLLSMNGTENWQGRMDEVRLWNYARSQTTIQNKRSCALRGNESGLLLYYPFDHGYAYGANPGVDYEWNNTTVQANMPYSSTLRNFALTGSTSNWICSSVVLNGICTPFTGDEPEDRADLSGQEGGSFSVNDMAGIKVYPNPNNGLFSLAFKGVEDSNMSWRMISLTGQVLQESRIAAGEEVQSVDASDAPAGLYFIQLLSDGKVISVHKFVKA